MTRSPLTLFDLACLALAAFLLYEMPSLVDMHDQSNYAPDVCAPFHKHNVPCP